MGVLVKKNLNNRIDDRPAFQIDWEGQLLMSSFCFFLLVFGPSFWAGLCALSLGISLPVKDAQGATIGEMPPNPKAVGQEMRRAILAHPLRFAL